MNRPVAAFRAGLDAIKPKAAGALRAAVMSGRLPVARLDDAVGRILTEMFAYGLVACPLSGHAGTIVTTPAHARVALAVAERSMVLLKNSGALPIRRSSLRSIAVIGVDAGAAAMSTGYGSAYVRAPFVITPLGAIRRWLGRRGRLIYAPAGPVDRMLPAISSRYLTSSVPLSGVGEPSPSSTQELAGEADLPVLNRPGIVTGPIATASEPGSGPGWLRWTATLTPPRTGLYVLSLTASGDTWLSLDHRVILAERGLHGRATWSTTDRLVRGRRYAVELRWFEG